MLLCSACNTWLTVQPNSVIVDDNLFSTDEGVKQALTGTYLWLRDQLYTPKGPMGGGDLVENLAASWTPSSTTSEMYYFSNHIYDQGDNVEEKLETVFMDFYKVIANVNPLLAGLEKHRDQLDSTVYNMVRGEALAIRALAHLDLIRLWGPVPSKVDVGEKYLPYVTVFSSNDYTYVTYEKYMKLLFEDLDEAERCLGLVDPSITSTMEDSETTTVEWSHRKSHINYYGVLGLQARAHLWRGDSERALMYAKMIKDAKNDDGTSKFRLTNENDFITGSDRTCYSEHLCGVNCETVDCSVGIWDATRATVYNGDENFSRLMFGNNVDDLRKKYLWKESWSVSPSLQWVLRTVINKYAGFKIGADNFKNFPIIRLAEIYLMVMECGTLTEANVAYKEFCESRNLEYIPFTESDRMERVRDEYIRELIGEGQNFFTYKRFNVRKMWFSSKECSEEEYRLPIPEREFLKE